MKKGLYYLLNRIVPILALSLLPHLAVAQECTTTWPYLYNHFQPATVYLSSGGKMQYTVNIHLKESKLHFLEEGNIVEIKSGDILLVEIGDKHFMNVNGNLMEIVARESRGFIAMYRFPDYTKLNETGGAYGVSSNTLSTKALSSVETMSSATSHMELKQNKEAGKPLPLKTEYYIITNKQVFPASRNRMEELLPQDRKENFKSFLKEHKIKWKSPESLLQLIDFFN